MPEEVSRVPSPRIAVVIPCYGKCPFLIDILRALQNQTLKPVQIVVGHSGDNDPTMEISKGFPTVRILHSDTRLYPGAARNLAMSRVTTDLVAFVDTDVLPVPKWLEHLYRCFESRERAIIVGSLWYARSGGYWGMSRWMVEFSSQHPYMPPRTMYNAGGGNMLVSVEEFRQAGGFSTKLLFGEDALLQANFRSRGFELVFCPDARGDHYNVSGFNNFCRHLFKLGKGGAIVRKTARLQGSTATRYVFLAPFLWIARLGLINYRVARWANGHRLSFLRLFPGIVFGLCVWNTGFLAGLVAVRRGQSNSNAGMG